MTARKGAPAVEVLADRGYFSGEEILACEAAGVTPYVPKPFTSGARANGRFSKQDFVYISEKDFYRCPAGQLLPRHMTVVEKGLAIHNTGTLRAAGPARSGASAPSARTVGSIAGSMRR